ncbi:MAG TPA: hypothetical protein VHD37_00025, partial [Candidatus Paceibacterota bacterium]|nr:hypothetical protein [Candidatus Paceibacterota bacterium]
KALKDILFSNLSIREGGSVSFQVTATVDLSLILYAKNLDSQQTLIPAQAETTTTAETPATPQGTSTPAN